MKKNVTFFLFVLLSTTIFAQKVVESPEYGFSTLPGDITKIELLDTTTVLHFHIKSTPGSWISIPKKSYIQVVGSDDKLFITKAEGIPKAKRYYMPDSGEVKYKLFFPKVNNSINKIDFGEANAGGSWYVYDIIINENDGEFLIPKVLRGNWTLADGSNQWNYGFGSKYALMNGTKWDYESVDKKGKKYTIILENDEGLRTIHAKLGKQGKVAFGTTPNSLKNYSLTKVINPNFKLKEDSVFEKMVFGLDSTTYSGMIKGFSDKVEQKTGMVYVNNAFTGNQESHLVKINEGGSFQSKLPLTHPQTVFVRMASGAYTVFLEPNKETFHYIHGKASFFMGDNAQENSGLDALKDIKLSLDRKERMKIGETAPEEYKKMCFSLREKALNELTAYQKNNFVSPKALQIKKLDLELSFYQELLGYNMYRRSLKYQNKKAKKDEDKIPYQEFEVSENYYDFLPKNIVDNQLLALSNGYYFFTNRLIYTDIFKAKTPSRLTKTEIAKWLQNKGVELTDEELNMVESSKQFETPEILAKEAKYKKAYGDIEQGFYRNYKDYFKKAREALKDDKTTKYNHFILSLAGYLKEDGVKITDEEAKMVEALSSLDAPEEIEAKRFFNEEFKDALKTFTDKYKDYNSEIYRERSSIARDKKIKNFFGKNTSFLQDVIKIQELSKKFEDYQVYNDDDLARVQEDIKLPFLKNYLAKANEQTKEKIEINKTKGGYTVHNVEKTEGDELFDSMIAKFKGKVVYVDFWATWCGPCKSGIERIKPLKEEMKNEDVVFLYITNQTSPEGTWKNSIPDIKGEHYRVSSDEWNYLTDKFKISGIPHYTLVNKTGDVVKDKLGHMTNPKLKSMLQKELSK